MAEASKKFIIITTSITLVIFLIILIITVVTYNQKTLLFKPYDPPVPPAGSVTPNGNPKLNNIRQYGPKLISLINSNASGYLITNPSTEPTQFGPSSTN